MTDPAPPRLRAWAGIPLAVWAAMVAFGGLASVWSVVAPLGEAPDETAHLALVWHLADGGDYPDFDDFQGQAGSFRLCATYAAATRACPRTGEAVTPTSTRLHPRAEAPDRTTRPAWDDAGGAQRVGPRNQMSQHPPLYYRAMAGVLQAERAVLGGPRSADQELALLRLVNVALVAPLPLLAWWAARRFGAGDAVGVVAAVATLAVPMLTHIGSTLNNDNLLTLEAALLGALLAGVLRGDRSTRTAIGIGVLIGLGLLTKAFAFTFPVVVVVAYLVGSVDLAPAPWRQRLGALVRPLAWAGGLSVALGAWWYLRVHGRTGQFTPSLESIRLADAVRPEGFSPDPVAFAGEFARLLATRFWGSFGWYSVRLPTAWALVWTVAAIGLVVVAVALRREPSGSSRLQRATLAAPVAVLVAFVVVRAWDLYDLSGSYRFIQGRYLFAGLVGVAVLVALGARRLVGGWAAAMVLAAAAVGQAVALLAALDGWWGGPGLGPRGQVQAMVAWGAWPAELVAPMALAAAAAMTWLVVEVALAARAEGVGGGPQRPGADEDGPVGSGVP